MIVYPTAIGSEPDHPDFDTEPLWEQVIARQRHRQRHVHGRGQPHRRPRPPLTFYGSSFISDPYGRVLVQAPRDEPAVLVADLDLDQRRDWLDAVPVPRDPPARRLRLADRCVADRPPIVRDFVPFPKRRVDEMRAYARRHYGLNTALLSTRR